MHGCPLCVLVFEPTCTLPLTEFSDWLCDATQLYDLETTYLGAEYCQCGTVLKVGEMSSHKQ